MKRSGFALILMSGSQPSTKNSPPPAGVEYVLGRLRIEVVQLANPETPFDMWDGEWESVSASGTFYDQPLFEVCCLEPPLEREGFEGATWEGWVPFFAAPSDSDVVATYQRKAWFKLRG